MRTSLFLWFMFNVSACPAATAPVLEQVSEVSADPNGLKGYTFLTDQAFKIKSGALNGKVVFFAAKNLGASSDIIPRFVVTENDRITDSLEIPTMQSGWNIVEVQAVAFGGPEAARFPVRILAILTLEPMSGRSSDYWDQAFVLDLDKDGRIEPNSALNLELSNTKPRIKTIKSLRSFLRKRKK